MSHDRYCRFRVKATVDGLLHIDGFMSADATAATINDMLRTFNAPVMDFSILYRALEYWYFHMDSTIGKTLVAFEIECIANDDGTRTSREPLPLPTPDA